MCACPIHPSVVRAMWHVWVPSQFGALDCVGRGAIMFEICAHLLRVSLTSSYVCYVIMHISV